MKVGRGDLMVIYGGMFAGKTTELQSAMRRAVLGNKSAILFNHERDTRSGNGRVVSHEGVVCEAVSISDARQILKRVDGFVWVGIDEAQFFGPEIIPVALELRRMNKRVVVAGLNMDFAGRPFGPVPELILHADIPMLKRAVCKICGEDAIYSQRLTDDMQTTIVGGREKYEARCAFCFEPPP
ncbi:thymidine kinase [Candidatus Uhrbacteria bacterium CG_4_9_14_3_um_filter_36_7]|uniref:Thymidine kinase n=1 Tax=Candidatus Uhrbacteria bacterium CG_4_9_14_3_um_filter_36_7 TaxID=1975033 RepID=A0A2M7XIY6_9BACT|nr:MAG: thymidine kinase [Candidatus Uhrbacteria bacterium CG_4_9_14_3_um_filter_36_7]